MASTLCSRRSYTFHVSRRAPGGSDSGDTFTVLPPWLPSRPVLRHAPEDLAHGAELGGALHVHTHGNDHLSHPRVGRLDRKPALRTFPNTGSAGSPPAQVGTVQYGVA